MTGALSLVVTAYNEEERLPGALASAVGVAAETVVVVDPRTSDRSRELAAAAGARVLEHAFSDCAAQCAWGVAAARHNWVFVLDADERFDERLRASVSATVAAPTFPAYALRRANLAFGRRLRFGDWGRDRVVRLFDRRRATIEGGMHWTVRAAAVGRLAGVLEHDTLRGPDEAAYFSLLGVVVYLTKTAVMETFKYVSSRPAGSENVFDYGILPSALSESQRFAREALEARAATIGEPWITYFDPFSLASELRDMGFKHVEDFGPEEANHRYFKDRADSLRISGSSHLMKACV